MRDGISRSLGSLMRGSSGSLTSLGRGMTEWALVASRTVKECSFKVVVGFIYTDVSEWLSKKVRRFHTIVGGRATNHCVQHEINQIRYEFGSRDRRDTEPFISSEAKRQ